MSENNTKKKFIVHVDMDAFFAAVEQRDNPSLKNKPVVIGAAPKKGKGRGVVSTCSYEARKFGIHSAMPISTAYNKCPHAVFLPPDMKKYSRASYEMFNILERFTPDIEPIGIDEAFLDITGSYKLFSKNPENMCRIIKNVIKKDLGLTISIGLAPNKMTAKIASDLKKPDGLVIVENKDLLSFLHPLPIKKLWGIGEKTTQALQNLGVYTIGDLAKQDITKLKNTFGKNGSHAWKLANGIDPRDVKAGETVKSISNEYTFEKNTNDLERIKDILMRLSEKISRRLRKQAFKGRTITFKIRFSNFKTYTRSVTLKSATNFTDIIYENSINKLEDFDLKRNFVRLLGIRVSNFIDHTWQSDLYPDFSTETEKKEHLHKAQDHILDKFGENTLGRRTV